MVKEEVLGREQAVALADILSGEGAVMGEEQKWGWGEEPLPQVLEQEGWGQGKDSVFAVLVKEREVEGRGGVETRGGWEGLEHQEAVKKIQYGRESGWGVGGTQEGEKCGHRYRRVPQVQF